MFMRILVFNKVDNLMEVKVSREGDLALCAITLEDKAKLLESLAKSDRNYKTKAVVLPGG
jgi:hypothetical protein